ncbi:MAG: S8 family serine peptidase [Bdellovibrio sp.]|nr:S8 family serine peptidase [Bdellovibrio sp.]
MKTKMFSLVIATLLATTAHAERVIVIMKDAKSFNAAHMAFRQKGANALKGHVLSQPVNGQIEQSLENLNTLIVNADNDSEISKLKADPAVAYVEKEVFHKAPAPVRGWLSLPSSMAANAPAPGTPWGINAVKAPQAWARSNQGQGARVLVLDTGVDANHPSIKANFEQGRDFTETSDGSDFSDQVGHGTHCSGTIAGVKDANGFTGVAPSAKLLMGRVCEERGCPNTAIAAGINWGISQKVDVISMSLGGDSSTPAERDALAKADRAGLTVVAASGNSGTDQVSYPAALPTVIAVGAVNSSLVRADFSQYGKELAVVAPGAAVLSSVPTGTGRIPVASLTIGDKTAAIKSSMIHGARELPNPETRTLVDCGGGKPQDFANKDLKDKYVLVRFGEVRVAQIFQAVTRGKAAGVIFVNNGPGVLNGAIDPVSFAVFSIEQAMGQQVSAQMTNGVEVKATLQTLVSNYEEYDGTSMATPHVAGIVALIKATNKKLTGAQVKAILTSTATPLGPNSNNEYGAGLVNAEAAVNKAAEANPSLDFEI